MGKRKPIPERPGVPTEQNRRPFLVVNHSETLCAAYCGFTTIRDFRTYLASDRFRVFFHVYRQWVANGSLPQQFKMKELLGMLGFKYNVTVWQLGRRALPMDLNVKAGTGKKPGTSEEVVEEEDSDDDWDTDEIKQMKSVASLLWRIIQLGTLATSTSASMKALTETEIRQTLTGDLSTPEKLEYARDVANQHRARSSYNQQRGVVPYAQQPNKATPHFVRDDLVNESFAERLNRAWVMLQFAGYTLTTTQYKRFWERYHSNTRKVPLSAVPFWMSHAPVPPLQLSEDEDRPEYVSPLDQPLPDRVFEATWLDFQNILPLLKSRAEECGVHYPQADRIQLPDPRRCSALEWAYKIRTQLSFAPLGVKLQTLVLRYICYDHLPNINEPARMDLMDCDWEDALEIFEGDQDIQLDFSVEFEPPVRSFTEEMDEFVASFISGSMTLPELLQGDFTTLPERLTDDALKH